MPRQLNELAPERVTELVCYAVGIEKWDQESDLAKQFVGRIKVREWSDWVRVFLTQRDRVVYAETNFVLKGMLFPTKLITGSNHSLTTIVQNLVMREDFDLRGRFSEFRDALSNKFRYFITQNIFDEGFEHLRFSGLAHCHVVSEDGCRTPYQEFAKLQLQRRVAGATFHIKELHQMSAHEYNVSGTGNVLVGAGATVGSFENTVNQMAPVDLDLAALAAELPQLRAALRAEAIDVEHDQAVASAGSAEAAAKAGDAQGTMRHLKAAGRWAFDIATKIGTSVAAKAIEKALLP